jgi:hypothetical protein
MFFKMKNIDEEAAGGTSALPIEAASRRGYFQKYDGTANEHERTRRRKMKKPPLHAPR